MKACLFQCLVPLITIVALSNPLFADELTGRVLDPDGRAVPNASLRLYEQNSGERYATRTSPEGAYAFRNIPSGEYLLEGDAADSALRGTKKISVNGNQTENLDLAVSSRSTEISVTANSTPMSLQETGKAIDVIDASELGLRNEFTLPEALRVLPGVRVQTTEGPGSFTEIKTRGLRSEDTALLIDGMRFHDASSVKNDATPFLEDMVLVDTDRIEFLRGSGSSLYGSNALAGTINLTSQNGGGPTHGSLRVEGGGLGMVRGVGNMSGGLMGDRIAYSGGISHLYITRGVRDPLPYRNNGLQGSAKYSFAPGVSITGRAWYSSNYLTLTEPPTFDTAMPANPGGDTPAIALPISELEKYERGQPFNAGNATFIPNTIDPDGRRRASFLNAMTSFQHQVGSGTSYRLSYQALDSRRALTDGPAGTGLFDPLPDTINHFDGFVDAFQARFDQRAGGHNLITLGYEFEQERYFAFDGEDPNGIFANRVHLTQRSHAFYIQNQVSLLDSRLQLTASGRTQFFRLKSPEFQGVTSNPYSSQLGALTVPAAYVGDAAVAYFVTQSRTKLRAHVGNSFRAPSGYERFGQSFGFYFGDPRLAPERAVAVDGGIDQQLFDSRLELNATVFYTNLQQTVGFGSFSGDPFGRSSGYVNRGGGIARGFELGGRISPRYDMKIQASYTYTNSDSRTPTSGANYFQILDVSPHVITVTATQWIARRTNVTFDMAAHSDYSWVLFGGLFGGEARRFRFNGPVKADIMVRHDLPFGNDHTLEIYGKVENVFGQRPYEDGFIGPKAWFITGARIVM